MYPGSEFELSRSENELIVDLDYYKHNETWQPYIPLVDLLIRVIGETKWDPVRLLKERKINVDYLGETDIMTPLAHAYSCKNMEVAGILLKAGADIHKTFTYEQIYPDLDVMNFICDVYPLSLGFQYRAVKQLCNYGFDARLSKTQHLLSHATSTSVRICKLLFQRGNITHQLWVKIDNDRPLHEAMGNECSDEMFRYLRQEEFMYHMVRLRMQRSDRLSAIRKLTTELWQMIGEAVVQYEW